MWHVWETRGAYRVLVGRPEGKRPLGIPRRKWENNMKMYLQEVGWKVLTGLIWLRIGTGVGSCECGNEIFGFHNKRGISWLAKDLLSYQGLCSM